MGLLYSFIRSLSSLPRVKKLYTSWGRVLDRDVWRGVQTAYNPDPIDEGSTGDRYFRVANNPHVEAGLLYSDASRLFVSARGLDPDEFGAFHPPQLGYTSPEEGDEEQLNALAYQYDEQFEGGFQPILKSLQDPAIMYGRSIGEISWNRGEDGKFFADFIYSRDPEEFVFSPPDMPPGLYRKKHIYSSAWAKDLIKMPPGKFMMIAHNPLFNNPYGKSLLRSLTKLIETWQGIGTGVADDPEQLGVFDAWREGMKKAGFGMWLGMYGPDLAGDDTRGVNGRAKFLAGIKELSSHVAGIFDARTDIRAEKLDLDTQAFMDFFMMYVQTISILLCGSATALIEGKFGSYAKEESTTVREKSIREQLNAAMLSLAFTYQFNRFWLHYNYTNYNAIPQLQLIPPNRIMPTTPQGQDTQGDEDENAIEIESAEQAAEFQQETEEDPRADGRPQPDIYFDVQKQARKYLDALPVVPYSDVTEENAGAVFTVKRIKSKTNPVVLLTHLKDAIAATLPAKTELEAWRHYQHAVRGILETTHTLIPVHDLFISFRQARQSAFQSGIDALTESRQDEIGAIQIQSRDDADVRPIHALWNGVTLKPTDPRLEKLRCPMDFGCRCNQIPIFATDNVRVFLTPEKDIPTIFPGDSYTGYAPTQEVA